MTRRRRGLPAAYVTVQTQRARTQTIAARQKPIATFEEADMNRDCFEGALIQLGGRVNEQWGKFTQNPAREMRGKRAQNTGKTQQRYGVSKEQAARQLKDFQDRNSNWHSWSK